MMPSKDTTGDTPAPPATRPRRTRPRVTVVEDEFRQWTTGDAAQPAAEAPPVAPVAVPGAPDGSEGHAVVMAGTFVIYEDGKGGLVLVVTDPAGNVTHKHIPAAVVGMAKGGGIMGRMLGLKGLMG